LVTLLLIVAGIASITIGNWRLTNGPLPIHDQGNAALPVGEFPLSTVPPVGPPLSPNYGSSFANQPSTDISAWKTLENRYGWSVKYPGLWEASGLGGSTADRDMEASLQGPKGCFEANQECGNLSIGIWIGSISPNTTTKQFDNSSPKEFLLANEFPTPPDPEKVLLEQGEATIAGDPAYYVVFRQKNFEDYPDGLVMKKIVVKDRNKFYTIASYETGKNKEFISSINSPAGWLLNPTYDKIVFTLSFTR
jgi:hypothetical protein